MLKQSITYTNPFTDQEVTEEHYFHISKADLVRMQMENVKEPPIKDKDGETFTGYRAKLVRIMRAEEGGELVAAIEDLVKRAYGKKDGDRFLKSPQIWEEFSSSEAYSQLFFELCTNAEKAASFMAGIIPGDLDSEAARLALEQIQGNGAGPNGATPAEEKVEAALQSGPQPTPRVPFASPDTSPPREVTISEAQNMDASELQAGLADGTLVLVNKP